MLYNNDCFIKDFSEADRIVVGIGKEFDSLEQPDRIDEILQAYRNLAQQLKEKDYFVVTLCYDDLICNTNLNQNRIVAPCGSIHQYQCQNNCNDMIYTAEQYYNEKTCSVCGQQLVQNTVQTDHYNEKGYLQQWKVYTEWFQKIMNKKTLLLELGVGLYFPGIIRFPFEKVMMYQQKAVLYRINESISQLPEEIADRAYEMHKDSVTFCCNEFV